MRLLGHASTLAAVATLSTASVIPQIPSENTLLTSRNVDLSSATASVHDPETKRAPAPGTCEGGPWVPWHIIGGRDDDLGPENICESHWTTDYQPITSIEAWTDNDKITGLRATYAGKAVGRVWGRINDGASGSVSIDYTKGERFTTVINYGNGVGTRLGHVYIETSGGSKLDLGKDTDGITPYPMDVGGGILLGLVGSSGDEINSMGYLFLASNVEKVSITDMTFDPDPAGTNTSLSPVVLSNQHYYNGQPRNNATWTFTGQQTETQSRSYTQSSTSTFGGSVTVELSAELFGIGGKVSTGFTWEKSSTTESSSTTTSAVQLNWGQSGSLRPGEGVDCTAYVQKGQGRFKYSSKVKMELEDGSDYTYDEKGTLDNVAISDAYISVKQNDDEKPPPGVQKGTVKVEKGPAKPPPPSPPPKKKQPPKKPPPKKPAPKKKPPPKKEEGQEEDGEKAAVENRL